MNKYYNVLWFEDEPEMSPTFEKTCREVYNIELFQCGTRADGIRQLEKNANKWDAVILDAKMPEESWNEVAEIKGLLNVRDKIISLSSKHKIPFFISTGQPDLCDDDTFKNLVGRYYTKGKDDDELIKDILSEIKNKVKYRIKNIYQSFFSALNNICIDKSAEDIIMNILLPMYHPYDYPDFSPKLHYNPLRQFLELLFRACGKAGIIPESYVNDKIGKVNLNQCSLYLSGKECDKWKIKYGDLTEDRIIPQYIETIIRSILDFGNLQSHTTDLEFADQKTIEKLLATSKSNTLIFGFTLQLMDVVIWFDELFSDIKSGRMKLKECVSIPDYVIKYRDKAFLPEKDENGVWHCEECAVIIPPWHKTEIVLKNIVLNTNQTIKEKYPYFARYELKK